MFPNSVIAVTGSSTLSNILSINYPINYPIKDQSYPSKYPINTSQSEYTHLPTPKIKLIELIKRR
jgi:hypothetical protein